MKYALLILLCLAGCVNDDQPSPERIADEPAIVESAASTTPIAEAVAETKAPEREPLVTRPVQNGEATVVIDPPMNEAALVEAIKNFVESHRSEGASGVRIAVIDAAQEFDCESQLNEFLGWFAKPGATKPAKQPRLYPIPATAPEPIRDALARTTKRYVAFVLRLTRCQPCDKFESHVENQTAFTDGLTSRDCDLNQIDITQDAECGRYFELPPCPAIVVWDTHIGKWHGKMCDENLAPRQPFSPPQTLQLIDGCIAALNAPDPPRKGHK